MELPDTQTIVIWSCDNFTSSKETKFVNYKTGYKRFHARMSMKYQMPGNLETDWNLENFQY